MLAQSQRRGDAPCRRAWQPTPVFLPGKPDGQGSLVGYSPRGRSRTGLSDLAHAHAGSTLSASRKPCLDTTCPDGGASSPGGRMSSAHLLHQEPPVCLRNPIESPRLPPPRGKRPSPPPGPQGPTGSAPSHACPPFHPLSSLLTLLQLHRPPRCSSNTADRVQPQGLCTGCSLCLNLSSLRCSMGDFLPMFVSC